MNDLQKIRRYELMVVFTTTLLFITHWLISEASKFEEMFHGTARYLARQKYAGADKIWDSLQKYNHIENTLLPIIIGAILLFIAWYVFHYLIFPEIREIATNKRIQLFSVIFLTLVFSSVYFYDNARLYLAYRLNFNNGIIGFKVFSAFRWLNVLSTSQILIVMIGLYELFAQAIYYIHHRFSLEFRAYQMYGKFIFLGFASLMVLSASLFSIVPISFFHLPMHNLGEDNFRIFYIITAISALVYVLQWFLYRTILPHFHTSKPREHTFHLLMTYLVIALVGSIFIWLSANDFMYYHRLRFSTLLTILFITIPASVFVTYYRATFGTEKRFLETQVSQKSAELSNLRSQINPHFLFNSLNTLYAIALKENAERTSDGIQKLGDMMRFMLHENNKDRILLSKEIEYLRNYIEIQKMRLIDSGDIEIRVNIQEPANEIYISPMLLSPFIENAFKHGVSFLHPSWIFITLTFDSTNLYFKVHNSIGNLGKDNLSHKDRGVGLENVKKRLSLVYPNRHVLTIQNSESDYFVSLSLTYW